MGIELRIAGSFHKHFLSREMLLRILPKFFQNRLRPFRALTIQHGVVQCVQSSNESLVVLIAGSHVNAVRRIPFEKAHERLLTFSEISPVSSRETIGIGLEFPRPIPAYLILAGQFAQGSLIANYQS